MEDFNNNTEINKTKKNSFGKYIVIVLCSMLISAILMFVVYPMFKYPSAKHFYDQGKYEMVIDELDMISLNPVVNGLRNKAEKEVAKTAAEDVRNSMSSLLNMDIANAGFVAQSIDENNRVVSFRSKYSSDNYAVDMTCDAYYQRIDRQWVYTDCKVNDRKYDIKLPCDQLIAENAVQEKYAGAELMSEGSDGQLFKEYKYRYMNNDGDPFIYTGYELTAVCVYDVENNEWICKEIRKNAVSSEEMPLKTEVMNSFTIDIPEEWYVVRQESGAIGKKSDYLHLRYVLFPNKEALKGLRYYYQPGGDSPCIAIITVYQPYSWGGNSSKPDYDSEINIPSLGNGYIKGSRMTFTVNDGGKTLNFAVEYVKEYEEQIKDILSSVVFGSHTYRIETRVNGLNVRKYAYKNSDIVGQINAGEVFNATEVSDDGDYVWYRIGDERYVADVDGQYLDVKYQ